jgi:hypothetical protein
MVVGASWLVIVNRRKPGIPADIEADLERAPARSGEVAAEVQRWRPNRPWPDDSAKFSCTFPDISGP